MRVDLRLPGTGAGATPAAGVILYRKLLEEQIKIVEEGGEPINTFRDPEANQSIDTTLVKEEGFFARLRGSRVNRTLGARKYSIIYREATRRIEGEESLSMPTVQVFRARTVWSPVSNGHQRRSYLCLVHA